MKKVLSLSLTVMASVLLVACGNRAAEESSSREESSRSASRLEASRSRSQSQSRKSSRKEASESRERAESEAREEEEENEAREEEVAGLGQEYAITLDNKKLFSIRIDSASNKLTGKAAAAQKNKNSAEAKKYTDGKPANALELKWTYTNYSKKEGWKPDELYFWVFDDKGELIDNRNVTENIKSLPAGKSAQATSWFVLPERYASTKYITIEYHEYTSQVLEFKIPLK